MSDTKKVEFGFQVQSARFKALSKIIVSGGNPVKDAKLEAIDYANDCFGKYESDKNSGNLENAFKAISYLPANLTFDPTNGLFTVAKDQRLLHIVSAKNEQAVKIKKSKRKADSFSLDLQVIAEWREWAIKKVVAVHAPKAKADFDATKYIKTMHTKCDENSGLDVSIIASMDVNLLIADLVDRGYEITAQKPIAATG